MPQWVANVKKNYMISVRFLKVQNFNSNFAFYYKVRSISYRNKNQT